MSGADWRSAEEGRLYCCGGNKSLSFKSSREPEYEDLVAVFVRFENKQSGADLDDHRGIKREALMSSLGCLGLGGRMMTA